MMQLNMPQWADIIVVACLIFILHRLGRKLVPGHPAILDLVCVMILATAFLVVWNLWGEKLSLSIPLNGWTIAVLGLLGLPGLLLILVAKIILC